MQQERQTFVCCEKKVKKNRIGVIYRIDVGGSPSSLGAGSLRPPVRQLRSRLYVFNDHLNLSVKITSSLHRLATEGYCWTRVSPHRTPERGREGEGKEREGERGEEGKRGRGFEGGREGESGREVRVRQKRLKIAHVLGVYIKVDWAREGNDYVCVYVCVCLFVCVYVCV